MGLFGEPACAVLCEMWVARMQCLFQQWAEEGYDDEFAFQPEDLAGFAEPVDFVALAASATGKLAERCADLRNLEPRARAAKV